VNANQINSQTVQRGNFGFNTYVHEIGHTLGLTHPGAYDNDGTEHTYEADAGYAEDTQQYTVMSYFAAGADGSGANYQGAYASTPMLHDILTIQALYGADMTTRTGDTVYGFNSTANRLVFDFEVNTKPVIAIWDAGGIDTLDTSGFTQSQGIDLHAGAFSDVGGLMQNVAIAYNCNIENAIGGSGADVLIGNDLANRLEGRDGADEFHSGAGFDAIFGGRGNDNYFVERADDVNDWLIEYEGEGNDSVLSKFSYTLGSNLENLYLDASGGDINATGNALDNTLMGNSGANTLTGGAGADTLLGLAGWDTMYGGLGDDTYSVDALGYWGVERDPSGNLLYNYVGGDRVIEAANEGFDTVISTVTYTLTDNVEALKLEGNLASLDGYGNGLDNRLTGNAGSNRLHGYAGADWIDGGAGADTMYGETGNDTFVVDDAGDVVIENFNEGTDTVRASINYTLGANLENLTLTGTNTINGFGNASANVLTGNDERNRLEGNGGADTLNGGLGVDEMIGGTGDDTYYVDNAWDVVTETAGQGSDRVIARASYSLTSGTSVEVLQAETGARAPTINLTGNELGNTLLGNDRANILDGGAGADWLTGGASNDTFVFRAWQAQGDTIMDFAGNGSLAGDQLRFEGFGSAAQGATLTRIDATHWQIHSGLDGHNEIITIQSIDKLAVHSTDYLFV
jgi:Ca2+-binding RTX toxin-like protein